MPSIDTSQFSFLNYLLKITPFGVCKKRLDIPCKPEFNAIFVMDEVFKVLVKSCD